MYEAERAQLPDARDALHELGVEPSGSSRDEFAAGYYVAAGYRWLVTVSATDWRVIPGGRPD